MFPDRIGCFVRLVLVGLVLARGRNQRAIHPVGIGRTGYLPKNFILVAVVVNTIRHQNVIGTTAAQVAGSMRFRRISPRPLGIGTFEVLAHGNGRPQQRSSSKRPDILLDPLEEAFLVVTLETPDATFHHARVMAIDASIALVDTAIAQTNISSQLAVECLTYRPGSQQIARTIVLIPVGEVLVLLFPGTFTYPATYFPALGTQIRPDAHGGLQLDDVAFEVGHIVRTQFLLCILRICLQTEVRGRIDGFWNRCTPTVEQAIALVSRVGVIHLPAHPACIGAIRQAVDALQVDPQFGVVIEVEVGSLRIRIGLAGTIFLHPRQVLHLRVVVQCIDIR